MAIKAEIGSKSKVKTEKPFPKLMTSHDNVVVLFSRSEVGVVVAHGQAKSIGYYSDVWPMGMYRDFDGIVTLSNE